jgi:hypothetical protein
MKRSLSHLASIFFCMLTSEPAALSNLTSNGAVWRIVVGNLFSRVVFSQEDLEFFSTFSV